MGWYDHFCHELLQKFREGMVVFTLLLCSRYFLIVSFLEVTSRLNSKSNVDYLSNPLLSERLLWHRILSLYLCKNIRNFILCTKCPFISFFHGITLNWVTICYMKVIDTMNIEQTTKKWVGLGQWFVQATGENNN